MSAVWKHLKLSERETHTSLQARDPTREAQLNLELKPEIFFPPQRIANKKRQHLTIACNGQ